MHMAMMTACSVDTIAGVVASFWVKGGDSLAFFGEAEVPMHQWEHVICVRVLGVCAACSVCTNRCVSQGILV